MKELPSGECERAVSVEIETELSGSTLSLSFTYCCWIRVVICDTSFCCRSELTAAIACPLAQPSVCHTTTTFSACPLPTAHVLAHLSLSTITAIITSHPDSHFISLLQRVSCMHALLTTASHMQTRSYAA